MNEDVRETFFDIDDDNAPGLDGYSACVLNKAWEVVGREITVAVKQFFSNGHLLIQLKRFYSKWKISNNVLTAQELLGGYNQQRQLPRRVMKVYIRKAYDTVE
ncbi:UNVERIFIED_CONTAM: hypothetical protein Sradi_6173900 [Sesamum radiatum]|uniref:Uncharacterized protein n=1 Tax=Sesamum radiatum TaxID=300843 RepID=A0AAW2K9L2_SESRA